MTPYKLNEIKDIIRSENSLLERIIFETGEIKLQIINDKIYVESKRYDNIQNPVIIEHKLLNGYDPKQALRNAERSIINRIKSLEYKENERRLGYQIEEYKKRSSINKERKNYRISTKDKSYIMSITSTKIAA
jgi:hypothetical protein